MTKSEIHLRGKGCFRSEVRPTDYIVNAFNLMTVKLKLVNSSSRCMIVGDFMFQYSCIKLTMLHGATPAENCFAAPLKTVSVKSFSV